MERSYKALPNPKLDKHPSAIYGILSNMLTATLLISKLPPLSATTGCAIQWW
jgi:hypothetical protein